MRDERAAAGTAAPAVCFTYSADRKGQHPQQHLADFRGIFQADGYASYAKLCDGGQVREAACWAHVRREFIDLHEMHESAIAGQMLDRIGALYAVDTDIRDHSPDERSAPRTKRPLPDAMKLLDGAQAQHALADIRDR